MPLRNPAPDLEAIQQRIARESPDRFLRLAVTAEVDDARYMHWDQLSRRTPPYGWTHEEWWFATKMRRLTQLRPLPLTDKLGNHFSINLNDEVLRLAEEIARRSGGTLGGGKAELSSASADLYLVRSLMEESIRSSQLEGASTTRKAAVEMIDSGRRPTDRSETMVLNNYLAMQKVKEHSNQLISPEFVLDLHRTVTQGTLDDPAQEGRMQTPDEDRVSVMAGNISVHEPPIAAELPERLEALCRFANGSSESTPYLPPVVRAIITHFMVGFDHYFEDGNGRTARALFYWSMLHNGYRLAEFAAISGILRKAPGQYGDAYQHSEDDGGDLTYFVLYQLRVYQSALDALDAYVEEQRIKNSHMRDALNSASDLFNFRQAQIVENLAQGEISTVTARGVALRYRVTEQTARNDLKALEDLSLLARLPRTRPAIWVPAGDLAAKLRDLGFKA